MSPSESASLIAQLAAEGGAWQALLGVLQEEEHALIEGDAEHLARLTPAKLAQLQTLSGHARSRHHALLAAGSTPDRAGMDAWIALHGTPEHQARWQQLCLLEEQAQAMNQRIGVLIEMRLSSTRQAMNVLIHAATSQGGLYDEAGLSVAAHRGKPRTAA